MGGTDYRGGTEQYRGKEADNTDLLDTCMRVSKSKVQALDISGFMVCATRCKLRRANHGNIPWCSLDSDTRMPERLKKAQG